MTKTLLDETEMSIDDFNQKYFNEITNIIRDRLGIVIHPHQNNDLFKTVIQACKNFDCRPEEYLHNLSISSARSPILEHLVISITVGETYFYRDKRQMDLLQNKILPELIAKKRDQQDLSLRIWSAGCASGEEIYTIAMMLYELLPDLSEWSLSLLGTDINTTALRKALYGQYGEWSMRAIPVHIKDKFFVKHDNQYKLADIVREMVKFDFVNLNDNTYPSIFNGTNSQDLILCRNVLIYFDTAIISRIMQKLNESLQFKGYLLLGASDPIVQDHKTELVYHYKHGMLFSREVSFTRATSQTPQKAIVRGEHREIDQQNRDVISRRRESQLLTDAKKQREDYQKTLKKPGVTKETILNLLNEAQWQSVLASIEKIDKTSSKPGFDLYAKATAFANLGQLEQAANLFKDSLILDPTNKYCHFTYALTLLELMNFASAENELRKAIFLDRNFVAAHYQLGLLLMRNKQQASGLKSLRNALSIASTRNASEQVHGTKGLSYGRLSEILQHEINLYQFLGKPQHAHENKAKQVE